MINVKSEIQYILVTRTLEDMAQAGFGYRLKDGKNLEIVESEARPVCEKAFRTAVPRWLIASAMDMKLAMMANWW